MHLPTSGKMNPGKSSVHYVAKRWHIYLCHVYIHLLDSMYTRDRSSIYDWKVQLRCQQTVYAAFRCSAIDEGVLACDSRYWRWYGHCWVRLKKRVEADIYLNSRAVRDQEGSARNSGDWLINEAAVGLWHTPIYTSLKQGVLLEVLQLV